MIAEMIAKCLNEGTKLDWNDLTQKKFFGWYDFTGSGFYCSSYYSLWSSFGCVSSRLVFKSEDLFWYAVKTFPKIYKTLMEK